MDLSVILCTYNNADRLRITLDALCELKSPQDVDWELVMVNNNSTDKTEEVIKSFADSLPITYAYEPVQGKSRALNLGLALAQGDLIVFTDDDVKPNPHWLIAYWEAYQERSEGYYFGGPIESEFEGEPPDEDFLEAATPCVAGLNYGSESHEEDLFLGANWACPVELLAETEGFDIGLGVGSHTRKISVGEETKLMKKLKNMGYNGWYVKKSKVLHFVPKRKCSLQHIIGRSTSDLENEYKIHSASSLLGFPLGIYNLMFNYYCRYVYKKKMGKKWKKDYVYYRKWLKCIEIYSK